MRRAKIASFFSALLNASLQSFVHKTLKDEQIVCIHRIACHGRDDLAVLLRKPIRDNPKIFTKSEKMFLKSERVFQIVMFFGNRRRRVYQI